MNDKSQFNITQPSKILDQSERSFDKSFTKSIPETCRKCKIYEDQNKLLMRGLQFLYNESQEVVEAESLWRAGKINFEVDQIGSSCRNENSVIPIYGSEAKDFMQNELGKSIIELQKSMWRQRIRFEDLILDVENLSKTSPFGDLELKENNEILNNTQKKGQEGLLDAIKDAKSFLDNLRGSLMKENISDTVQNQIKKMAQDNSSSYDIVQTLKLQLEQSKRERRLMQVELKLYKNQLEKGGHSDMDLREQIRSVLEKELKQKVYDPDGSVSSSFNI